MANRLSNLANLARSSMTGNRQPPEPEGGPTQTQDEDQEAEQPPNLQGAANLVDHDEIELLNPRQPLTQGAEVQSKVSLMRLPEKVGALSSSNKLLALIPTPNPTDTQTADTIPTIGPVDTMPSELNHQATADRAEAGRGELKGTKVTGGMAATTRGIATAAEIARSEGTSEERPEEIGAGMGKAEADKTSKAQFVDTIIDCCAWSGDEAIVAPLTMVNGMDIPHPLNDMC
ncbi:hypothetical protein PtB15_6B634 [Puccinia triticina]|nr:hypothetical protein PtB15_6B634 [Puccinia triticina]